MRTIRRTSYTLNRGKWNALVDLVNHYGAEKDSHLLTLASASRFASWVSDREWRDDLLHQGYVSPQGLQARMWKMALKEAYETLDKQGQALAAQIKPRIAQHHDWSDVQKRYAYWLLSSSQRLAQLVSGQAPIPKHFEITLAERKAVQNYLRRVIRRKRNNPPRVRMARSAAFDANMYTLFEHNGTHYIKVMGLTPKQRIVIPLTGNAPIRGNIRLVLDEENQRVEVHYTTEVKARSTLEGEPCGLDVGVSEVFTDEQGNRYGHPEFGEVLGRASEQLKDKGRSRLSRRSC